jgi:exodeoxyribonuclease VII large subunit
LQSPKTKQQPHAVLTVSQLTAQIKDVVERVFDNVYVVGEVSNAKAYPSGHWYFSLKDKDATIPCVCFRSSNSSIKFKLEDGLMLVAQGNLSIYPPKGAYQLVASALEPVGIGEWQLAFEQLRAQLEKEGLLDPVRKRPIPTIPRRVGVVTSPAAAALRDILSALSRRNKNVNVVISPTRVQGEGSAEEIAQAIRDLQNVPDIDVIIVARGGGSIEDLWSFNTDVVARAVAGCPIPVVSGVGHETDVTICDLVADLRAPTPTAAAELVAKGSQELLEKYKNLEQTLFFRVEQRVSKARRQLERLSPVNALTRYQGRLKQHQLRIQHFKQSVARSVDHLLKSLKHRWHLKHDKLHALAPTNVLSRGFAILRKADGSVVTDVAQVQPGEELQAILRVGCISVQVGGIQSAPFVPERPPVATDLCFEVDVEIAEPVACVETMVSVESAVVEVAALTPKTVFDPELADPNVLAKIFADDLADMANVSSIFKANANERVELSALNAELVKDRVPLEPVIEGRVDATKIESRERLFSNDDVVVIAELSQAGNIPDIASESLLSGKSITPSSSSKYESTPVSEAPGQIVQETPIEKVYLAKASAPVSERHRAPAKAKAKPKVAAHQLMLFSGNDGD